MRRQASKARGWMRQWVLGVALVGALAAAHAQGQDPSVTVAITLPANGAVTEAPANIALAATASVNRQNWAILRVEFYSGTDLIGAATSAPYTLTWSGVAAGNYTVSAKAIATNPGQAKQDPATHPNMPTWQGVSAPVAIRVDAPPTVALTAPANNTVLAAPASIALSATAADAVGTVTKVDFYQGATLIGTASAAPYTVNWNNVSAGTYTLTAVATNDAGGATTSSPIAVRVDSPPTVSLTAPANNAVFAAPGNVALNAAAADAVGTLTKVDFYQGGTLLGTVTAAPYTFNWSSVPAGTYMLTAIATNDATMVTTSAPVAITVDAPPTVSLSAPANNALYTAPAAIQLAANAADADGTLAKVDFYQGTSLIGSATAAPYTVQWANVAAGNYTITAVATDNLGLASTSAPVPILVNAPPAIALSSPAEGATFIAPATVTLTATASDADGAVARVEFFEGANLIAGMTQAPYSAPWQVATAGSYTLFAKATDDRGAVTQAIPVHVTVKANTPPAVSMTSPAQGAAFKAPATIALAATAADADGTIAKVEFFDGANLIATVSSPPYGFQWTGASVGTHSLTAVATDNLGAKMISGAVTITVSAAVATVYYIHADHLNTPRVITDQQQRVVWRWDNTDPFGANVPDEDPSGLGTFTFDLRFPGQVWNKETQTAYNYFRDCYDPATGRFCQSDPIGLMGGINPYVYVGANPLSWTDPSGLKAYQCRKPLDALTDKFGPGVSDFAYKYGPYTYHQYSCVVDRNGKITCGGQDHAGSVLSSPGKPSNDVYNPDRCEQTQPDNNCFEQCLINEWAKKRPRYGIPFGTDCQEYDDDVNQRCRKQCKIKK